MLLTWSQGSFLARKTLLLEGVVGASWGRPSQWPGGGGGFPVLGPGIILALRRNFLGNVLGPPDLGRRVGYNTKKPGRVPLRRIDGPCPRVASRPQGKPEAGPLTIDPGRPACGDRVGRGGGGDGPTPCLHRPLSCLPYPGLCLRVLHIWPVIEKQTKITGAPSR